MDLRLLAQLGGVRTKTKSQNQAPAIILSFTGEVLDPTGLYELGARSYDPITGRFLSTDPVVGIPASMAVTLYYQFKDQGVHHTT
jgi:RHS repeat-associated protein